MNAKSITQFPNAPDIESSTSDYANRFSGEVGAWLLKHQEDATRQAIREVFDDKNLQPDGGLRILDVGGGHGQNIALMRELGYELVIVGSDTSCTEVIQPALDRGEAAFQVANLLQLPFDDNSFDVVICYRILSHMASWKVLVEELGRVAKNLVLVDYPSRTSVNLFADLLFSIKKRIEKNTRPYGCYSDSEIDTVFAEFDYSPTFRHRQFFLPMALYRLVNNLWMSKAMAGTFRRVGLTGQFGSPVIAGYRPDTRMDSR